MTAKLKGLLLFILLIPGLSSGAVFYKDAIVYKDAAVAPLLCPITCLRDGIYFGAGVGYDAYNFRQSTSFFDDDDDLFFSNPQLSAKGWVGNLTLGYGQYYGWIYIAGEISAMISNANSSFTISSTDSRYKSNIAIRESYAAYILPGYRINNKSLLYGKIGYVRTAFKMQEDTAGLLGPLATSTQEWGNGLGFGLGIETLIQDHWSVRTEYTYTTYSGVTSDFGTEFAPANNQFLVELIYHLC